MFALKELARKAALALEQRTPRQVRHGTASHRTELHQTIQTTHTLRKEHNVLRTSHWKTTGQISRKL